MQKRPPAHADQPTSRHRVLENAIFALRMQRAGEAERLALDVLKADRSNAVAAQILGRALLMQNRPAEAVVPLKRAARRADDPAIETVLASALAESGQRDEALDQLKQTTTRRPPFPPAFLEHARLLTKAGRLEQAVAVLEGGLALVPEALDLRMELGFLHVKQNDRAKARDMFQSVLAAAPDRHDALGALAKVKALDGEYAAAAETYRQALAMRPDDDVLRNSLGICQLEMGERDAGEASLRAAMRGNPQMAGRAVTSLAASSHGRFFTRLSAAAKFLQIEKP